MNLPDPRDVLAALVVLENLLFLSTLFFLRVSARAALRLRLGLRGEISSSSLCEMGICYYQTTVTVASIPRPVFFC